MNGKISMIRVESSNLESIGYDSTTSTLYVAFLSGATYRYDNVPYEVYVGLMNAESHGRYFWEYIRDIYPTTKL